MIAPYLNSRILIIVIVFLMSLISCKPDREITLWLIGDSTMADYANYGEEYMTERYPQTGWGQMLHHFTMADSLKLVYPIDADSVVIDNRARGGRSTRSFFEEGRWSQVYHLLSPGDWVLIQFGHNDSSPDKVDRYTTISGYKEYLRLYVNQTREQGATPVFITSVCRNYPWVEDQLQNSHGEYPAAMREVADELNVFLIDLTVLSAEHFSQMGREYVTNNYFMNLPAGKFEAYPDGMTDNTHFQPEGAMQVARLVFEGLKELK